MLTDIIRYLLKYPFLLSYDFTTLLSIVHQTIQLNMSINAKKGHHQHAQVCKLI